MTENPPRKARQPHPGISKLRVLVVDDSLSIRSYLAAVLADIGVGQVLQAGDGNAALEIMADTSQPVDILISDLAMPNMDGVELLREVSARSPGLAVLTISSLEPRLRSTVTEMAEQLGLQVLGVLGKPFHEGEIAAAVGRYLASREPGAKKTKVAPMTHEEIWSALDNKRVVVHYQPKVRIDTGHVIGWEALVRLMHPTRGLVPPDEFIGTSEEGGQIENLTYQVIEVTLRHAGEWARQGLRRNIGINIAASAIKRRDLPEHVEAIAKSHGLSTSQVTLEITETALANPAELLEVCARFRMRGFGLAIDDFGTGESGLPRLQMLPFTELKIDRRYVHGASRSNEARTILESTVNLGKKLSMMVVAEGVQEPADWDLLEAIGCDVAQGYLVSRPLPPEKVLSWTLRWERLGGADAAGVNE